MLVHWPQVQEPLLRPHPGVPLKDLLEWEPRQRQQLQTGQIQETLTQDQHVQPGPTTKAVQLVLILIQEHLQQVQDLVQPHETLALQQDQGQAQEVLAQQRGQVQVLEIQVLQQEVVHVLEALAVQHEAALAQEVQEVQVEVVQAAGHLVRRAQALKSHHQEEVDNEKTDIHSLGSIWSLSGGSSK